LAVRKNELLAHFRAVSALRRGAGLRKSHPQKKKGKTETASERKKGKAGGKKNRPRGNQKRA